MTGTDIEYDHGMTTKIAVSLPDHPYGIIQPTLFQKADQTLVMFVRSRGVGVICRAESKDAGVTWSPAARTDLDNPSSGVDVVQAAKGELYLVYNPVKKGRTPLVLGKSVDEGATWKTVHTFEDQPGEFSYPAIIQAADGRLHATYTWNRTHIKHVVLDGV